jgi:TonB-dependent SusC/RagA subfamily outer membrane receptor
VILAHETGHVAAGDPLVLAAVCALAALMPWNPVLWIILGRARLAVELDCDARVLRGGVSPRSYGSLLVDVAERSSGSRLAATALADDSSHLQQRILAMQPRRFSYPVLRGASAALIALAGLLAACEAKVPTAAEIEQLDAQKAEQTAHALGLAGDSVALWLVDGERTSAAAARRIASDSIATVNISKSAKGPVIVITTKRDKAAMPEGQELEARARRHAGAARDTGLAITVGTVSPLVLIDGVRSNAAALKALDRSRIEQVDVLKGNAAAAIYGADAAAGVIVVKTKAAGR